jgi:predicted dehydrogenase
VGVIGGGFMAGVHTRAARAAGAEVLGIASSSPESTIRASRELRVPRAYESAADLLNAPDIDTIHICAPNATHEAFATAALANGKHVVCEKPLAVSAAAAGRLQSAAEVSGTVATVPFIYRFHPMAREASERIRSGSLGRIFAIHGEYLQDWLLTPQDDNWRVDATVGGPSRAFADIGSHLCDLLEFVAQDRISRLCALTSTVHASRVRSRDIATEDVAAVAFQTLKGAVGTLLVSQVSAGRKNRLSFEISGENENYVFDQEAPELLWVGRREGFNAVPRDAAQLTEAAARYSLVPAGHPMGYQDAFNAFVRDSYAAQVGPAPSGLPTFADGLRAALLTDAVLRSSETGTWVTVAEALFPAA